MDQVLALQRLDALELPSVMIEDDDFESTCSDQACGSCNDCSTVSNGCFAGVFAAPGF